MARTKKISGVSTELSSLIKKDILSKAKLPRINKFSNLKIGISISNSEDIDALGLSKMHLKDATIEFARYLLVHGATLVYGGDLRQDGYTFLFSELAYQYREKSEQEKNHFINYFSYPIYNQLLSQHRLEFKKSRVEIKEITPPDTLKTDSTKFFPPTDENSRFIWAESLHKMRVEMNKGTDARIFIGGQLKGYSGKMPGIIEEVLLTLNSEKPVYLIGAFGGATKVIIDSLLGHKSSPLTEEYQFKNVNYKQFLAYYNTQRPKQKIDYSEITKYLNKYTLKKISVNNGLSIDENKRLFETQHIPEMIYLVLKGLSVKFEK